MTSQEVNLQNIWDATVLKDIIRAYMAAHGPEIAVNVLKWPELSLEDQARGMFRLMSGQREEITQDLVAYVTNRPDAEATFTDIYNKFDSKQLTQANFVGLDQFIFIALKTLPSIEFALGIVNRNLWIAGKQDIEADNIEALQTRIDVQKNVLIDAIKNKELEKAAGQNFFAELDAINLEINAIEAKYPQDDAMCLEKFSG